VSKATIRGLSVDKFLDNMYKKELSGANISEDVELWYDHTTEWKYSDYDIINSVAKYITPDYKGEFYNEVYNLIDTGWSVEEMVEGVMHYNGTLIESVIKRIVKDIIDSRGDEEIRAFQSIAVFKNIYKEL
jgi:hypothetical protein